MIRTCKFTLMLVSIVFFVLFFSSKVHSQSNLPPKDVNLSITLSVIDPSLGMFYLGRPGLGVLYWTLDKVSFVSALLLIFDIRVSLPATYGLNVEFRLREFNVFRVVSASLLGAFFIGFRIFAVIDARKKTLKYNKRLFENRLYFTERNNHDKKVNFFIMTDKPLGLGLRFDF